MEHGYVVKDQMQYGLYSESLNTNNLAESSLGVTSLGDKDQYGLVFVYIKEEDAHAHAQNTPIERFLSIAGKEVVSTLLGEITHQPVAYPVMGKQYGFIT